MPTDQGHGRRGRPIKPVIGYGPVPQFARDLRDVLGISDGQRSLADVAKAGNCADSSVSAACAGKKLPTESTVHACLRAVGKGKQVDLERWSALRDAAERDAKLFRASSAPTPDGIVDDLRSLLERLDLDSAALECRIVQAVDMIETADDPEEMRGPTKLPERVPAANELAAILAGQAPLTPTALDWIVFAAGGTLDDRGRWTKQLARVFERLSRPGTDGVHAGEPRATTPDAVVPAADDTEAAPRDRRPLLLLLSGIGVVVFGLLGSQLLLRHGDRTAPPGSSAPTDSPTTEPAAPTTRDVIGEVAARVCALPNETAPLPFVYIRRLSWSDETTGVSAGRATADERTWWNPADRSGIRKTQQNGPGAGSTPRTERFGPGQFTPSLDGEISTDPATLIDQITVNHPARVGPARAIRGAQDLFDSHVPSTAQRCAFLRGIADAPGLVYRDQALDQRGRPGVAVSGDDARGLVREEMIIDSENGEVLAFNSYDLSGMDPVMTSSVTYVERGYAGRPG